MCRPQLVLSGEELAKLDKCDLSGGCAMERLNYYATKARFALGGQRPTAETLVPYVLLARDDSFGHLLHMEARTWPGMWMRTDVGPWWTTLHHKLAIYGALYAALLDDDPDDAARLAGSARQAADRVVAFASTVDAGEHRQALDAFCRAFVDRAEHQLTIARKMNGL
ncbi:hypothetical protein JCM10212_004354 [Sporobolomyces blumeae]